MEVKNENKKQLYDLKADGSSKGRDTYMLTRTKYCNISLLSILLDCD